MVRLVLILVVLSLVSSETDLEVVLQGQSVTSWPPTPGATSVTEGRGTQDNVTEASTPTAASATPTMYTKNNNVEDKDKDKDYSVDKNGAYNKRVVIINTISILIARIIL